MQRELRAAIQNKQNLVLYGNGLIAHLLYGIFSEQGYEKLISAFAVSKNEDKKTLNDIPVILISDVKEHFSDCIIVISVENSEALKQMVNYLNMLGIKNYILLSKKTIKECYAYQNKQRKKKITRQLGCFYGFIYRMAYFLHKKTYIRFIGKKVLKIKTVQGNRLLLRLFSRDLDFYESIYVGKWNIADNRNIGEYDIVLRDCDTIFDFGANIGLFTLKFASELSNVKFVSVEPERKNFMLLKKNTSHLSNVYCVMEGVWYRKALCKVFPARTIVYPSNTPSEGGFYIGECEEKDAGSVRAYPIAYFINKYKSNKYVIKMDVEGAEKEIFEKGNLEWINNCVQLIIETHSRHVNDKTLDTKIINIMEGFSFAHYIQGENIIFERQLEV